MFIPFPSSGASTDPDARLPRHIRSFVALALLAGSLLVPATAVAHAELATVTPADTATVEGPPAEIDMTFTQHLDPAKSSILLVDGGGTVIAQGSTVDADRTTMRLPIATPLAPGTYTTRWTSFSADDNEQDRGMTTFTVVAAPSSQPTGAAILPSPSAAPTTPIASTGDVVIPVVVALVALVGLGAWLRRGRGRAH